MPSYTVSKNGYQSTSGSFTWADSNITVTLNSQKPERLYAWTDSTVIGMQLYAWTGTFYGYTYWTTVENPTTSSHIYDSNGNDVTSTYIDSPDSYFTTASSSSMTLQHADIYPWPISNSTGTGGETYNRDTSKDVTLYNNPPTVYTSSATITTGMTLYDNTGTDTGKTISTINQDGSWDLASSYTFSFDKDNTVTNYVIDGVTYTDDTSVDLADGTHTIVVNGSRTHVYIQGYATCDGPGATISFIVSGSVITLILPNAGGNETFDAATLTYPIQLTIVNEPI